MSEVLALLLGILVVLVITAATGFFVAQEFAYMAVDRSRLESRAAAGDQASQRALSVTRRTSFMLSAAQLGITVTGLLVGYVAEPLIGQSASTMFGWAGVPTGTGLVIGTVLALLLSTFIQMVFGELVPKNLAIARSEPVARWLSRPTVVYLSLFGWLVSVFDKASNLLLRMVRIEPVHDVEHAATPRDLAHIVAESRKSGELPDDLSVLLDRILDFPHRDVEHAMIPRARVDVVRDTDTLREVRELMAVQHSRYPVLDEDEHIVGVVHLADLLDGSEPDRTLARAVARPAVVVPTLMTLPDALRELNASRNELACVVDEYGGLAGVVTLEDLAEELVGEITDEHDDPAEAPPEPVVEDEGVWMLAGDLHIDEVERTIGHELPSGDYETVAGMVIATHGALPEPGTTVRIPLEPDAGQILDEDAGLPVLVAEVLEVERYVPSQLRLTLDETPPADPADREETDR